LFYEYILHNSNNIIEEEMELQQIDKPITNELEGYINKIIDKKINTYFSENGSDTTLSYEYRYCNTGELANILNVSKQTVTNRTTKGYYKPIRSGRLNIFDLEQVREINPVEVENYFQKIQMPN
jgi:hypothetical protein